AGSGSGVGLASASPARKRRASAFLKAWSRAASARRERRGKWRQVVARGDPLGSVAAAQCNPLASKAGCDHRCPVGQGRGQGQVHLGRRPPVLTALLVWAGYASCQRGRRVVMVKAARHVRATKLRLALGVWAAMLQGRMVGLAALEKAMELCTQKAERLGFEKWCVIGAGAGAAERGATGAGARLQGWEGMQGQGQGQGQGGARRKYMGSRLLARLEHAGEKFAAASARRRLWAGLLSWRDGVALASRRRGWERCHGIAVKKRTQAAAINTWRALTSRHCSHRRKLDLALRRSSNRSIRRGWWAWREQVASSRKRALSLALNKCPHEGMSTGMPLGGGAEQGKQDGGQCQSLQRLLDLLVETCAAPPHYPIGSGRAALGVEACRASILTFGLVSAALYEVLGEGGGVLERVAAACALTSPAPAPAAAPAPGSAPVPAPAPAPAATTSSLAACTNGIGSEWEVSTGGADGVMVLGGEQGPPLRQPLQGSAVGRTAQTGMPLCTGSWGSDGAPPSAQTRLHGTAHGGVSGCPALVAGADAGWVPAAKARAPLLPASRSSAWHPPTDPCDASTSLYVPIMLQAGSSGGAVATERESDVEVVGVLQAVRAGSGSFSGDDARALSAFCGQLAVAMVADARIAAAKDSGAGTLLGHGQGQGQR
ncbi:unnamed protein product, partial [Discosporangium mesarthrocarpum]